MTASNNDWWQIVYHTVLWMNFPTRSFHQHVFHCCLTTVQWTCIKFPQPSVNCTTEINHFVPYSQYGIKKTQNWCSQRNSQMTWMKSQKHWLNQTNALHWIMNVSNLTHLINMKQNYWRPRRPLDELVTAKLTVNNKIQHHFSCFTCQNFERLLWLSLTTAAAFVQTMNYLPRHSVLLQCSLLVTLWENAQHRTSNLMNAAWLNYSYLIAYSTQYTNKGIYLITICTSSWVLHSSIAYGWMNEWIKKYRFCLVCLKDISLMLYTVNSPVMTDVLQNKKVPHCSLIYGTWCSK